MQVGAPVCGVGSDVSPGVHECVRFFAMYFRDLPLNADHAGDMKALPNRAWWARGRCPETNRITRIFFGKGRGPLISAVYHDVFRGCRRFADSFL